MPDFHDSFRHSGWAGHRRAVFDAFTAENVSTTRQTAFGSCGQNVWVTQSAERPGSFSLTSNKCHDRFCIPCVTENARKIARVVRKWIEPKTVRFLTLTLRHNQEPLKELLDRLYASFKKLRRTPAWRANVSGGVAFFELTWGEKNKWHPHLHVLIEGCYFPQKVLKALWLAITGDSSIVDIRPAKDKDRTASYVAKYAAKGWNQSVLDKPDVLQEAIRTLTGRRLASCFGTWRGLALKDRDAEEHWEPFMSLTELKRRSGAGDSYAVALLQHLTAPEQFPSPGVPPERMFLFEPATPTVLPPQRERQIDLFHNWSDVDYGRKSLYPL